MYYYTIRPEENPFRGRHLSVVTLWFLVTKQLEFQVWVPVGSFHELHSDV